MDKDISLNLDNSIEIDINENATEAEVAKLFRDALYFEEVIKKDRLGKLIYG